MARMSSARFGAVRQVLGVSALEALGQKLDMKLANPRFSTVRELLAWSLLRIRMKDGHVGPLELNSLQKEFEKNCGRRNIVVKARQMGMTTWIAARYFLKTVTHPGTL